MIKLLGKIPKEPMYVAVSGGVDSMAALDFLKRGKHTVTPVFFNHGTETSDKAQKFLRENVKGLMSMKISGEKPKDKSWEEWWREERYKFFDFFQRFVITAHHLNDEVETWIWSCIHGQPKLIKYKRNNVIRPFLLTPKKELEKWAGKHKVAYIEDASNFDVRFQRNRVRHNLIPEILKINSGIETVVRKKVLKQYNSNPEFPDSTISFFRNSLLKDQEKWTKEDEKKRKLSSL